MKKMLRGFYNKKFNLTWYVYIKNESMWTSLCPSGTHISFFFSLSLSSVTLSLSSVCATMASLSSSPCLCSLSFFLRPSPSPPRLQSLCSRNPSGHPLPPSLTSAPPPSLPLAESPAWSEPTTSSQTMPTVMDKRWCCS